jgi:hypothetical protein
MSRLALGIQTLRDNYVRTLNELHDDYVHTRMLWQILHVWVQRYGENLTIENPITKSRVNGVELAGRARPSMQRLTNRTFKDIVAQLELFVAELLRQWLLNNTDLIAAKALNVGTLLESKSLADVQDAAVKEAVESTIVDKMFGKPEKWFSYLKNQLHIRFNGRGEASFCEMKARRDVLEHNNGIVNPVYIEKARVAARYKVGDDVQLENQDVDEAYQVTSQFIHDITASAIAAIGSA